MIDVKKVISNLKKKSKSPKKSENIRRQSLNQQRKSRPNFDLHFVADSIPQYNSLLDKHLRQYFSNPNVDFKLAFEGHSKHSSPLKRHSYANVLYDKNVKKKKKRDQELKKLIDFIESQNNRVRHKHPEELLMSPSELKQYKKEKKQKKELKQAFKFLPLNLRGRILSFLPMKESLNLVQVFGCHSTPETWKHFLNSYFNLYLYPIFEEKLEDIQFNNHLYMNYYKLFKYIYNERKRLRKKFFTIIRVRSLELDERENILSMNFENLNSFQRIYIQDPSDGKKFEFSGFDDIFLNHITSKSIEKSSQDDVYKNVLPKIIISLCRGINVNIFAYGAPKSGKTFQIFGQDNQSGLLSHCSRSLFNSIERNTNPNIELLIHVAMIEIDGGQFIDMFNTSYVPLDFKIDSTRDSYLENLTILPVLSWKDMMKIIDLQRDENNSCLEPSKRVTIFQLILTQIHNKSKKKRNYGFKNNIDSDSLESLDDFTEETLEHMNYNPEKEISLSNKDSFTSFGSIDSPPYKSYSSIEHLENSNLQKLDSSRLTNKLQKLKISPSKYHEEFPNISVSIKSKSQASSSNSTFLSPRDILSLSPSSQTKDSVNQSPNTSNNDFYQQSKLKSQQILLSNSSKQNIMNNSRSTNETFEDNGMFSNSKLSKITVSTLNFIDLPGSMLQNEIDNFGINKILLPIQEVLKKLYSISENLHKNSKSKKEKNKKDKNNNQKENKSTKSRLSYNEIPFKNNALSSLLESQLKSSSKIYVIGCISSNQFNESLNTLEYVAKLKGDHNMTVHEIKHRNSLLKLELSHDKQQAHKNKSPNSDYKINSNKSIQKNKDNKIDIVHKNKEKSNYENNNNQNKNKIKNDNVKSVNHINNNLDSQKILEPTNEIATQSKLTSFNHKIETNKEKSNLFFKSKSKNLQNQQSIGIQTTNSMFVIQNKPESSKFGTISKTHSRQNQVVPKDIIKRKATPIHRQENSRTPDLIFDALEPIVTNYSPFIPNNQSSINKRSYSSNSIHSIDHSIPIISNSSNSIGQSKSPIPKSNNMEIINDPYTIKPQNNFLNKTEKQSRKKKEDKKQDYSIHSYIPYYSTKISQLAPLGTQIKNEITSDPQPFASLSNSSNPNNQNSSIENKSNHHIHYAKRKSIPLIPKSTSPPPLHSLDSLDSIIGDLNRKNENQLYENRSKSSLFP